MPALYDFSNPVMMAVIANPDGSRIPLWTNSFEDGVMPPLPILTDLSVQLLINQLPVITATLAGPYEYMIKLLNEEKIQYGFSHIQVQFGYVGAGGSALLSPVYSGLLTTPDVSIAAEEVSVNLVGQGGFFFSSVRTQATQQAADKTRLEIIEELVQGVDPANPRRITVDAEAVTSGAAKTKLKDDKVASFAPGHRQQWVLIQRFIKESQCWFRIEQEDPNQPAKLIIEPIDENWIKTPAWKFQLFPGDVLESATGNIGLGPATGIYPILSFNTPTSAVFYPTAIVGAYSAGIDDETGEVQRNNLDDQDQHGGQPVNRTGDGVQRGTGGVQQEPDTDTGAGLDAFHADNPNNPQHIDRIHSQIKSQYQFAGLKVEIESLGVPDLLPGRTAQVAGLGTKFDWNYGIHEVVHTLGTGGFSTQWTGYVRSSVISAQAIRAFGFTDNPEAEPGEGDSASTEGGSGE